MNNSVVKYLFAFVVIISNSSFGNSKAKVDLLFSHDRGFYYDEFTLLVSCDAPNSIIRYTLDGSNPLNSSKAIISNSPAIIIVDPTITTNRDLAPGFVVRACATSSDTLITNIVTNTYMFPNMINVLSRDNVVPGPGWLSPGGAHDISYGMDPEIYNNQVYSGQMQEAFLSIPTLSIVTSLGSLFNADSGIYVNPFFHGEEWERSASLELLNPNGTDGFQINCGIRIRGGWSRHLDNPKHAFRVFFREEYGKGKLKYPLFDNEGTDEFDKIDIRTSQNYSWSYYGDQNNTFLRDVFSRDTQRDMNQPYTRSTFNHLFINGTYWGLYQIQERSEAAYAESYFGGEKEDYDVIKVDVGENFDVYNVEATDGTLSKWKELWDAGERGFSDDESYFKVQGLNPDLTPNAQYEKLLDVDNLIDYMIVTFFAGDFDGPISGFRNNESPNNFYAIYNRVNPDGFKFFRHDAEHTLFFNNWGIDRTGPFPAGQKFVDSNPQWIHQKLSVNKNYRLRFADRVYKHFYNEGALTLEKNKERINKRKSQIVTAIVAESARWGDSKSSTPLTKANWTNAVNFILNSFLPSRNNAVLEQLKNKGLSLAQAPPQFNLQSGVVAKGTEVVLNSPNGEIYFTIDGSDPYSPVEVINSDFSRTVISISAVKKVLVPTYEINSSWKSDLSYDTSAWLTCDGINGGIGYDDKGIYDEFLSLNIKSLMHESGINPNTSCFIRIPFSVDIAEIAQMNFMNLDIFFDDGFVAYLNGTKVAESNIPDSPVWNSTSNTFLDASGFQSFNLSEFSNLLKDGENLLAIHGVNTSKQSSDFIILPTLTIGKSSLSGSISPSAILYDKPIIIDETTTIKTRSLDNGNWSVLDEHKYIIDEDLTNLKVTELHYHPQDFIVEPDTINDKEFEFIELKNIGPTELNLTSSSFVNGISFTFPQNSKIMSNEFIVLASNSIEFAKRYGFFPFGEYEGQLDNGGEKIVFINAAGDTTFSLSYDDKLPWPEEADGTGFSLVSFNRNPTQDPNNSNYWIRSASIHGSPGSDDLVSDIIYSEESIPSVFSLSQNYPNPFNPTTVIMYSLPSEGKVQLQLFDLLGREVLDLVNENQKPGNYSIQVNGSNLASGIYFYKLQVFSSENHSDFITTKKMILLK